MKSVADNSRKAPASPALANASPLARSIAERLAGEHAVTLQALERLLPEDVSADEMDEVFFVLGELGVNVAEAEPAPKEPAPAQAAAEPARSEIPAAAPSSAPTRAARKSDDSRMHGVVAQYLSEISGIRPLSEAEEESLARLAASGDERAIRALVESHLRLVVKIVREYRHSGLARMDLIQAGNMGLLDAAHHFRPGKSGRFSHFASWWVRQGITRHVEAAGLLIRLPRKLVKELHSLGRERARTRARLKREPTDQEAADALGWPVSKVQYLDSIGHNPLSLDSPLPRDEEKSFEEVVVDLKASEQAKLTRKRHVVASLHPLLAQLTTEQRGVLSLRYGLSDQVEHSVNEVADLTSLSREEVRALEREGLRRLAELTGTQLSASLEDDDLE
ncbi:MAG: sigma-70 family RNA polymerase sigma factor [Candidatus Wallbacteria bacterium]|nr:sigma-70 family RNA polymerase sigma factor [Candidatus Wallbacteria bacterium]